MNLKNLIVVIVSGILVGAALSYGLMMPQMNGLQDQISELQNQLISKDKDMQSLTTQIGEKDQQINSLSKKIDVLEKQLLPYRKGEWNVFRIYTGSGGLTTDYFNVSQSELRLIWNFTRSGSELDMMNFFLYPQGTDKIGWGAGIIRDLSGIIYIHNITPGLYYLKVANDRGITNWTVILEIWVPK